MAQIDVNQAIAGCRTYRDVLPLLENLMNGASHAKAYSTDSLATAMHRIASTGASEPGSAEVLSDRRFQALIHEVENRLRILPQEFNNQSLANVVWGAGKLRLTHRPELFAAVEREVLNFTRRPLSAFTPQQLAAIAWGFVAADMNAPRLFYAIQNEARSQPVLDDLLQKAGLLQHLRQRGILSVGLPAGMNGGWNQGILPSQGAGAFHPHSLQGNGGFPVLGSAPTARPNSNVVNSYPSLHGSVLPTPTTSQVQYPSQVHPSMVPFTSQMHQMPHQQGPANSPRLIHGVHSAQGLPNATAQHQPFPGAGGGAGSVPVPTATPVSRYDDVSSRPDVAIAAEEHKREMERKQREVLGDADSEWSCPLCIEPMDDTDISFLPCPCGYQICRLCYHRIVKTETGTCPACRAEYKEENIQKKSIPDKKKKEGEVDPGWETGAGKKKANKEKKPAGPYAAFPVKVRELLLRCHEIGHVVRGELDERVLEDLRALPERGAVAVLNEFIKKDMSRIRNKCAFLHRIIQRVQQEEAQAVKGSQEKCASAAPAIPPSAQLALPPQRARAVSDVGCAPKNGVAHSGSMAMNGYQQGKGMGGWAEKENGRGQVYGCNGVMAGPIEMNGDSYRASGDLITPEYGHPRRHVDEYHQSRPSLQLPGGFRQANAGASDSVKYRESAANGVSAVQQQFQALKFSAKEPLSPAASAEAGSRLLAMLQGNSQAAGSQNQFSSDWKQERPPLFARAGGGNAGREAGPGAYRSTGTLEEHELLAMIASGEGSHSAGSCGQCGQHKFGEIDTSDGNFYCEDCWKAFESSRNEGPFGSMVKL